jgi:hypothetical protein
VRRLITNARTKACYVQQGNHELRHVALRLNSEGMCGLRHYAHYGILTPKQS